MLNLQKMRNQKLESFLHSLHFLHIARMKKPPEGGRLADANDAPAIVHFPESELPAQGAGSDKVIAQAANALGFFEVLEIKTVADRHFLKKLKVIVELDSIQLNFLYDQHSGLQEHDA
jgi:hypothetical protein